MHFAGGTNVDPGTTGQAIVDLTPGEWLVWTSDLGASQKPELLTVTGDFPTDVKDPESDLTVTYVDFAISIEGNLAAGKHLVKIQNHGAQPHFLVLLQAPDGITRDDIQKSLIPGPDGAPEGTPEANPADQEMQPVYYTPEQSIGTATWHQIELAPGTYIAACFFPTAGVGAPHAMFGMYEIIKVTG